MRNTHPLLPRTHPPIPPLVKNICLLCCLLLAALCTAGADAPAYTIRFGIMETDKTTGLTKLTETTTLPFKTRETGFQFGFEIIPPDDKPYTYQVIGHLPSPPKQLSGLLENIKPSTTITSPTQQASGTYWQPNYFDLGDPLGEWKLDVLVNGKLQRTITFTVSDK